ncbi:hypothetical protein F4776DRAFT_325542 [Hypoxylon sp. NC0597]|nr:hypothetical protein F4776DRAFT_325542 [Hypoxylon sp. NC0597]
MVVIRTLPLPSENIWYLAYGSNLSSSKFVHDRGIVPLDTVVVSVPDFTLSMESAGVPYQEPSFASIRPLNKNAHLKEKGLLGTAYLVTPQQYSHIIASEGGGIAYKEVLVEIDPVEKPSGIKVPNEDHSCGMHMTGRTLVSVMVRQPAPRPSRRYMNLIIDGASESNYPTDYQNYLKALPSYEPPTRGSTRIGATLFLSIWVPIMMLMEKITKIAILWNGDEAGNAPHFVIWLVRITVMSMWWHHDHIHAPVWGRGDGLDQSLV